jgi:hypothetical protein
MQEQVRAGLSGPALLLFEQLGRRSSTARLTSV